MTWGPFRHHWVVFKLVINPVATVVMLTYMDTFRVLAGRRRRLARRSRRGTKSVPAVHAALALVLLLVATTLAIVKPLGTAPYGRRRELRNRAAP
jgi:hypothetical protein